MDTPDPAFIQRNVQSLSAIGGLYDFIALEVERTHWELLQQYRLDTGAKCALDLIADRDRRSNNPEKEQTTCQSSKPVPSP